MATLVNKGLEMKAKLLNGVSTAPFTYHTRLWNDSRANDQTALVTEITTNGEQGRQPLANMRLTTRQSGQRPFPLQELIRQQVGIFNDDEILQGIC